MKRTFIVLTALVLATSGIARTVSEPQGAWKIDRKTSPLTGALTVAATLISSNKLINTLGNSDNASLIMRCGEGGLAIYVSWPQVVSFDSTNFVGQPKTMALWRIDAQKIDGNFWDIDSTGTAAGEFKSRNAQKFIGRIVRASKLVVRLTGRQTQDAEFNLTGIDQVAAEIAAACGVKLTS